MKKRIVTVILLVVLTIGAFTTMSMAFSPELKSNESNSRIAYALIDNQTLRTSVAESATFKTFEEKEKPTLDPGSPYYTEIADIIYAAGCQSLADFVDGLLGDYEYPVPGGDEQ